MCLIELEFQSPQEALLKGLSLACCVFTRQLLNGSDCMCLATSENLGREKTDVTGLLVLAHDSKETGAPNTEDKGKSRGSIYRHRAQPLYVGNSVVSFCPWGLPWEQGSPYRFQVESCWALREGVNQRWKEMGKELVGGSKTSLVCKNPKHGWGSQIQVVG